MALRTSTYLGLILGLALVILALGGLGIWYQSPSATPGSQEERDPAGAVTPSVSSPPTASRPPRPASSESPGTPVPHAGPSTPPPLSGVAPELVADFPRQLDKLFDDGLEDAQITQRLLSMMPQLVSSNQVQAAEVLVDLVPDESYSALIPLLTNALSNAEVLDVLMGDLLSRPDATQLPLLWEMARTPDHPRRIEAKEYLALFLEEDYGNDWGQWARAVQKFLNENPP